MLLMWRGAYGTDGLGSATTSVRKTHAMRPDTILDTTGAVSAGIGEGVGEEVGEVRFDGV